MSEQDREQSDPGFRIVDKRQSAPGGEKPAGQSADADSGAEDAAGAEAAAEVPQAVPGEQEAPLEAVTVLGIVEYCVTLLNAHAWQCMGLVMNPLTGKVEKDLEQARVAIDCVEALFSQVESRLPDAEVKRFRQLLTDLRVNFVQQSQKPPS
jgi:hypothetical protein